MPSIWILSLIHIYEGQLEDLEERLAKAGNRNEDLIRQQTRLEEHESQISQSLRKFATQLAEDYQMTLEAAKGQVTPLENVEQTRQNLQSLERSIKACLLYTSEKALNCEPISL